MTETQREGVPRNDDGELDTALAFLRFQRHCLVKKTQGLTDDQLRAPGVPSGTSLLGLVRHLTDGERYWFGHTVAGEPDAADVDFAMDVAEASSAAVLAAYDEASRASDAILLDLPDGLDTRTAAPVDDAPLSVRWVVAHMTAETARHVGHADILREQIDGVTGR